MPPCWKRDVTGICRKGPGIVIAGPRVSILVRRAIHGGVSAAVRECRSKEVVDAIRNALEESGVAETDVLVYATTRKKVGKPGNSLMQSLCYLEI